MMQVGAQNQNSVSEYFKTGVSDAGKAGGNGQNRTAFVPKGASIMLGLGG